MESVWACLSLSCSGGRRCHSPAKAAAKLRSTGRRDQVVRHMKVARCSARAPAAGLAVVS
jgi:hypothetical protein